MRPSSNPRRFALSGAAAGVVSTLVFTVLHHVLISDIWFSLPVMAAAGALCGLCLGWSYGLLSSTPSLSGWVRYNLYYAALFVALGGASVLVYEPVTTIAAVIATNAPPTELFMRAMPLTLGCTVAGAILIGRLYGSRGAHYGAVLLTCSVLVALLGINVSAIGLVSVPSSSLYLIIELFALILVLAGVYAAVFAVLERVHLGAGEGGTG